MRFKKRYRDHVHAGSCKTDVRLRYYTYLWCACRMQKRIKETILSICWANIELIYLPGFSANLIGPSGGETAFHWLLPTSSLTGGTTTLNTWRNFVLKSHSQLNLKPPDFLAFHSQQGFSTALHWPDVPVNRLGVKMGDSDGYKLSNVLLGHTGDVRGLATTPDGALLSASRDKTAKLWRLDGWATWRL